MSGGVGSTEPPKSGGAGFAGAGAGVVCVGLATLDTILAVPSPPPLDGRTVASELVRAGGGPAATAAVTLSRLGVETSFVGAVGDDDVGREIRVGLAREGVDVSELAVVAGARSPQSTVLVCGTSRSIVHYPGTARLVLSPRARELCENATWVHVDNVGYGAVPGDVRLSIDGGNAIEGLDLHGVALYAPTESSLHEAFGSAEAAIDAGAETVAVTRGADGSFALTAAGERVEAPGFAVDAVSTLGAGDVFHGALLAALVGREPLRDALELANRAAALSCRALDGRSAIPSADELERSAA